MKRLRLKLTDNRLFYSIIILVVAIILLLVSGKNGSTSAFAKDAPGEQSETPSAILATFLANPGTLGPIPDNSPATPRDVTFTVSGITGTPGNVEVSITFNPIHTWVGDLNVTLIAPNGATHVVFGRTGQVGGNAGDSSDVSGPYNLKDSAAGTNWWTEAFNRLAAEVLTPGDYRTTQPGPQPVNTTSPVTNMTAAFAGVANPNGTWTLRFTDNAGGDTGSVSAASLTIGGLSPQHYVDFDGDGKTDYSVVRNTGGTPAQLTWFNRNSLSGSTTAVPFGIATSDFFVPEDYDGDGKTDIAVWRPGVNAYFYILQSMTGTLRSEQFGITGDDPAVVGDYDGDGKADPAVYRCPPIGSPGQCFFYYRGSNANPMGNVTSVAWGFGQQFDFFANPGDFDGDGKNDFCIQRTLPGGAPAGQFVLKRSSDGGIEYINWGLNNDIIVPGDYDGDGRSDFCVSRTENIGGSSGRSYYILERDGGGTGGNPIRWGIAGDIRAPGDYDGDGKTDFAVWRPTPAPATFYVRRSSDGSLQQFQWGLNGDGVVAAWSVH